MPWMYLLRCRDGSYYAGSTTDLDARLNQHRCGLGAAYTRRRLPVNLVFAAEFETVAEAFAFEKRVQGWSRAKREALIESRYDALPGLARRGGVGVVSRRAPSSPSSTTENPSLPSSKESPLGWWGLRAGGEA